MVARSSQQVCELLLRDLARDALRLLGVRQQREDFFLERGFVAHREVLSAQRALRLLRERLERLLGLRVVSESAADGQAREVAALHAVQHLSREVLVARDQHHLLADLRERVQQSARVLDCGGEGVEVAGGFLEEREEHEVFRSRRELLLQHVSVELFHRVVESFAEVCERPVERQVFHEQTGHRELLRVRRCERELRAVGVGDHVREREVHARVDLLLLLLEQLDDRLGLRLVHVGVLRELAEEVGLQLELAEHVAVARLERGRLREVLAGDLELLEALAAVAQEVREVRVEVDGHHGSGLLVQRDELLRVRARDVVAREDRHVCAVDALMVAHGRLQRALDGAVVVAREAEVLQLRDVALRLATLDARGPRAVRSAE